MLKEGEAVLIRPRQIHITICPELQEIELIVLKFDPALFLSPIKQDGPAIWLTADQQIQEYSVGYWLDQIQKEYKLQSDGWCVAVRSFIWMILLSFCRISSQLTVSTEIHQQADEQFYPVFQYLSEHFTEPVAVDNLLSICHLSYSRFSVRFRLLTGCSLTEYICRARIQLARTLLLDRQWSVADVAQQCGYLDLSYFDRLFRRYTGYSPSQFRRLNGLSSD